MTPGSPLPRASGGARACRGFSLVELMLALTLGMIVIAGMAQLFRGAGEGHLSLENDARTRESGRYALAFLGRSARNAGFRGCGARPGALVNTLNGDLDALFEQNLARPVQAFDSGGDASAAAYAKAAGIDPGSVLPDTDMVTFRRIEGPLLRVVAPVSGDANPTVEAHAAYAPKAGDFLLIGDCEQSSLFRLTGVIRGDRRITLLREPGSGIRENAFARALSRSGKAYGSTGGAGAASVGRVLSETYFVAEGRGPGRRGEPRRALWRRAGAAASAEIVEGVHDLEVEFAVDVRPDDGVSRVGRYLGFADVPAGSVVLAVRVRVAVGEPPGRTFSQTFRVRNAG